jgi:hypothetical protein
MLPGEGSCVWLRARFRERGEVLGGGVTDKRCGESGPFGETSLAGFPLPFLRGELRVVVVEGRTEAEEAEEAGEVALSSDGG